MIVRQYPVKANWHGATRGKLPPVLCLLLLVACRSSEPSPSRDNGDAAYQQTLADQTTRLRDHLLRRLQSRITGIREHDLNFQDLILQDRNRYFAWLKEPQARMRAGKIPKESTISKMVFTHRKWATYFRENAKWIADQVEGVRNEIALAHSRRTGHRPGERRRWSA